MRKSLVAATAALACAMALAAAAQEGRNVTTSKDKGDTVKLNVSGRIVLDYVWRSKELTVFTEGFTAGVTTSDSENTFEGYAAVRVDVDLSEKVSAVVEIGTLRTDPIGLGGGLPDNIREMGYEDSQGGAIALREAHVKLSELLMPELNLKIGIQDWAFDVRGKGHGFAFDPRGSQSIVRGYNNGAQTIQESAFQLLSRSAYVSEQFPVGVVATYVREAMTLHLVALPAIMEGGNPSEDEALYALDLWYNLDQVGKGSRVGVIGAISTMGAQTAMPSQLNDGSLYTVGVGVDLKNTGVEGLELYGEVYKQFGKAGQRQVGADEEDLDAKGLAFQIGAEYHFSGELPLWVGINYTYVSGDGDDDPTDDEVNRFLSYENVNDLLIVEDMYFGLDVDRNYTALKISAGGALSVGTAKNNLEISAILGLCKTQEKVTGPDGDEDKLGTEFDIRVKYLVSKQVALTGAYAILTGSDVMEQAMGGSGAEDAEDKCSLLTFGVDVKF